MSMALPVVTRRWDGKAKEASLWDFAEKDADLYMPSGSCLAYFTRQDMEQRRAFLRIPFEQLVYTKCHPLIEKIETPDYFSAEVSSTTSKSSDSLFNKKPCSLCLEAPQLYDAEAVKQYNITTRNFFAWIMNKPIVGPDPSSALLALKLRMDVWRSSSVDNMSDLYQYAKSQGYGDLGDMQLFLSNHLRGLTSPPTTYKLLSAPEQVLETEEDVSKLGFRKSIRKRLSSFAKRKPTLEESGIEVEMVSAPPITIVQAESALMSGAVSPSTEIELSVAQKPSQISAIAASHNQLCGEPDIGITSQPTMTNPRIKQAGRRTYSMPVLPKDASIEDLARELEKQSQWIQNLTREHFESAASRSTSSLPALSKTFSSPLTTPLPRAMPSSPQSPSRMASHRRRASLSRPPSPIQEEESTSIRDVPINTTSIPAQSSRRFSTSAITTRQNLNVPTKEDVQAVRPLNILKKPIEPCQTPAAAMPVTSIASEASKKCVHSLLPSHTRYPCKNCGKPKLAGSEPQARSLSTPAGPSKQPYRLSLDLEAARDRMEVDLPVEEEVKHKSESAATLADQIRALTRFPSLRRRRTSSTTPTSVPQAAASATAIKAPTVYKHAGHVNMSMPNLSHLNHDEVAVPATDSKKTVPDVSRPAMNTALYAALSDKQSPRTSSSDAPEIQQAPVSRPTLSTESHRTVEPTSAWSDSPTEISSPVTPMTPIHPFMSKTVSADDKKTSPVARLKAQGIGEGLWSTILADPKAVDGHRVPFDEMTLGTNDMEIIDNMLADMTSTSASPQEESPRWSQASSKDNTHFETPFVTEISSDGRVTRPTTEGSQAVKKKSFRNSLRLWTSRKSKVEQPVVELTQYQANVLVLDSSGSFSTLVSPIDDVAYGWEEKLQDRSRTPLCELP